MSPKEILTKKLLEEEYINNKLSTAQIAKKYNIRSQNSVFQAIKRYNLFRDSIKDVTNKITKDWLYQKYVIEDLSAIDIAKILGIVRKASILDKLKEFDIPIRKTTITKKSKITNYNRRACNDIHMNYWSSLKTGAKRRNLEFSISIEYGWRLFLNQNKKCAISDIDLIFRNNNSDKKSQTASLDRIDSSKGYVEGNVQWVHKKINTIKWDLDQKEFIELCYKITDFQRSKI